MCYVHPWAISRLWEYEMPLRLPLSSTLLFATSNKQLQRTPRCTTGDVFLVYKLFFIGALLSFWTLLLEKRLMRSTWILPDSIWEHHQPQRVTLNLPKQGNYHFGRLKGQRVTLALLRWGRVSGTYPDMLFTTLSHPIQQAPIVCKCTYWQFAIILRIP